MRHIRNIRRQEIVERDLEGMVYPYICQGYGIDKCSPCPCALRLCDIDCLDYGEVNRDNNLDVVRCCCKFIKEQNALVLSSSHYIIVVCSLWHRVGDFGP